MKEFKIKSFCKINLLLRVIKKLRNGYHNIFSLITFCDLHDYIYIREIKSSNDKISFYGEFKKNINLESNTIIKVLYYLRKKNLLKKKYFNIRIKKNIPAGSGLGGGSSNAAVLLNFFKSKIGLKISKKEVLKIARKIGSDVPIFLSRKNTILTGKKNEVLRVEKKFNLNVLIVYPNIHCSTKKIYAKNIKFSSGGYYSKYLFQKNKKILIKSLIGENNDLEEAAIKLYPAIGSLINLIKIQKGCYFSRITGSGSACIGIFKDMKTAINAKKLIKRKFPKYLSLVSKTI